jgi:hypothetical protein
VPLVFKKDQHYGVASIPIAAPEAMHAIYIVYAGKEPVSGGIQFIQFNPE